MARRQSRTTRPAAKLAWLIAVAVGATLSAVACDGGGGGGPTGQGGGKVYVVSTGLFGDNEFIGYLATVPSLDEATTFSLEDALEIEPSWIFAKEGQPYVYAASLAQPTIDRYRVGDDGGLTKDGSVSFAAYGLESAYMAAMAPIFSDEKSYFVDDLQDQMVIWNPKEMKAIGTIAFHDAMEGALPATPEGTVVVHDSLILTSIQWLDWTVDSSQYGSHVRLLAIDPATDTIVKSTDDDRLTYASPQARASDGTEYFSPASLIAAYSLVPGHGSPSRVLRVRPGAREFEPTYALDLSALVGGRPAGDFTLLDDQTALLRAWHSDLADPVTAENWQEVLWQQAGFKWWRWHVGDVQAVEIPNQSPGTLGAAVLKIDGQVYVLRTNEDSTTSTLDHIDAQGAFVAGLSGPGQFIGNGVIRIR
jgi:hypothetical protein